MKIFKPKFWDAKNVTFVAIILYPVALVLQIINLIKIKLIITKKFKAKIICVGNIYLGGTGKTPLAIKLVEILKKINKKSVIIKKFYKNQFDEIELIKKKNKSIFFSKSRILAINEAIKKKYDTLILDDGFQDHTIFKDLNIICFNENQLIGNGLTIPAGPLRQNLKCLKKCHIIIINGKKNSNFEKKLKKINNKISIFYSKYELLNTKKFKNKNLFAFAGIGNPLNFFKMIKEKKLKLKKTQEFPDHYKYSRSELNELIFFAKRNDLHLLTTEKDYFRFKNLKIKNINHLKISLKIKKEKKLVELIKKYLK
ncbi:tetraacyldisaccharide 4'-kinase [Pelagibacteraceae bacterium]|nr:tetraacyldisaccharide 4'-kinase [Pelagibacteraceae bacterium]